jgi:hypothetical protein
VRDCSYGTLFDSVVPRRERFPVSAIGASPKKQRIKLRMQKRRAAAASSFVARLAELRQGFVEVVGQQRHAEQI